MRACGQDFLGLHVLADDDPGWPDSPVEQARNACAAGATVVQLRAKHSTDSQCFEWARTIRSLTRDAGVRFVVNDRFDIALLADADAVHLGQTDLPPSAIPKSARARLAIGRSTHNEDQLKAASQEDIDYVAFGPVFGTTSKESEFAARGLDALASAVQLAAPRPLVAIGGIRIEHLKAIRAAGVAGIAVISSVAAAVDPIAAARALQLEFSEMPS